MRKFLFVFNIVLCIVHVGLGQNESIDRLHNSFDKLYGSDELLNNGKKYFPKLNLAKGYPFWGEQESFKADLTIFGKTFLNQQLKYDLHKQEFILFYTDLNGQKCQIILARPFIDSVKTENTLFIRNPYTEIRQFFVQMVHRGKISCCVGLSKDLEFSNIGVSAGYGYSKEIRTYYLIFNKLVYRFRNKSTFIKIFPLTNRADIRKQISLHRLKFRKIDEAKLRELIEFCDHTVR